VVVAKYRDICKVMPTRSILDLIRKPTIDMWQWEDYEVVAWFIRRRKSPFQATY